ncbi:hypothetical protein ACOV11_27695, partial [Vibrio natriegens]
MANLLWRNGCGQSAVTASPNCHSTWFLIPKPLCLTGYDKPLLSGLCLFLNPYKELAFHVRDPSARQAAKVYPCYLAV